MIRGLKKMRIAAFRQASRNAGNIFCDAFLLKIMPEQFWWLSKFLIKMKKE